MGGRTSAILLPADLGYIAVQENILLISDAVGSRDQIVCSAVLPSFGVHLGTHEKKYQRRSNESDQRGNGKNTEK